MMNDKNLGSQKNKLKEIKRTPELRFKGFSDDWEQCKLGKVFKTYSGMTPLRSDISNFKNPEVPWIKTTDLKNSDITSNDEKISAKAANKLKVLPVNTVLIAMYGGFNQIGRTGLLTYPATINQALTALEPNDSISPYFLLTELNYRVNDWKKFAASSRKDPNITKRDIDNFMINFPTQQEQQKIGSFFQQLDNTITLHQRKLDKLKQLKQGYLQQLFPKPGETVPKIRFANFEGEWEERKLRTLLIKNSKKNKDLTIKNVESISNRTGFTKQTEQFDEYSVASADLSNYYVITEQQFAYNPSRINVGSIAYKPIGDDTSVVSPLYVSFSTKKILNDSFLWNWFKTSSFENQRQRLSEGGVRDTLSFNQLSEMSIVIPQYLEQVKIGNFFKQLDFLITLHQEKLKQLKTCKKALLQKMFI
ncbi:restriction endonuclease subunit S [Lactococcus garvieae]|uniref:restriction endonuclease subunit S n=1 Tax=Lactococcus garvieae TaxID=1363 RepID=UPI001BD0523D|nr:restriction endonuclease subunit S [Lactococcus garvieae]MBS4464596.1 restriction endonuclease subunit S [Lactococcus garvieae]